MHASLFASLAAQANVLDARPFSQRAWRARYAPGQGPLCSAFTQAWLSDTLHALPGCPLQRFNTPSTALVAHLLRLQAHSHYPAFPNGFVPGASDLALLAAKYGARDWPAVQRLVARAHGGDYLLYDLARSYRFGAARVTRLQRLAGAVGRLRPAPPACAVIAVLRYRIQGQDAGHRVAYYHDAARRHHFFDPDAGAVVEPDGARFRRWLLSYLRATPYRRCARAVDPFLTLYALDNARARSNNHVPCPGDCPDGPACPEPAEPAGPREPGAGRHA